MHQARTTIDEVHLLDNTTRVFEVGRLPSADSAPLCAAPRVSEMSRCGNDDGGPASRQLRGERAGVKKGLAVALRPANALGATWAVVNGTCRISMH